MNNSVYGKATKNLRISVDENNKVVLDEIKLVKIFSMYFGNIAQNLGIDGLTNISSHSNALTIIKAIEKCQNHPIKKVMREIINTINNFSVDLLILNA